MADLTIRYYGPEVEEELQSYDLRVVATVAADMPKEVFVFQRIVDSATDPAANALGDQFISIADPVDLEQYPVGAPDLANDIPYYRLDEVTLRFRDMLTLEETRNLMAEDFQRLVDSLNAAADSTLIGEVTYA